MPEIMDRPEVDEQNDIDLPTQPEEGEKLDVANSNFDNEHDLKRWIFLNKKQTEFGLEVFPEEEKKELEELNNRSRAVVYVRRHGLEIDRIDDLLRPLTWEENKKLIEINRAQINRDLTTEEIKFRKLAQARIDLHGLPRPDFDTNSEKTIN